MYGLHGIGSRSAILSGKESAASLVQPSMRIRFPSKPVNLASPPVVLASTKLGVNFLMRSGSTVLPFMNFPNKGKIRLKLNFDLISMLFGFYHNEDISVVFHARTNKSNKQSSFL